VLVKKLLLLCSLSAALLTPVAVSSARQKAGHAQASQRVKRAIKSMARAIDRKSTRLNSSHNR
jgi:hypothetical protein